MFLLAVAGTQLPSHPLSLDDIYNNSCIKLYVATWYNLEQHSWAINSIGGKTSVGADILTLIVLWQKELHILTFCVTIKDT